MVESTRLAARDGGALRIIGVDPELNFSGGESQVLGLTLELLRMGHQAHLLCNPSGELWRRATGAGVTCHALAIRNSIDLGAGLRMRRFLRRYPYHVIHFHTARAHSLAPFAGSLVGARVVTRRMDYVPKGWMAPYLYNRAVDAVAAISHAVAESLYQAGVHRDRVTIIPSGVDCAHYAPPDAEQRAAARAALAIGAEEIAVGTAGALEARKGHRYLIDAIARLARRDLRLKCFIAGSGALHHDLLEQVQAAGLTGLVRLLGGVDDPRKLFWALDIYCQPSLMEGLGVAVLEAMACGLPVIGSRAGGIPEVVGEQGGQIIPPGDCAALAEALANLSGRAAERAQLAAAARTRILEQFSMAATARQNLQLYRMSLKEGSNSCAA